MASRFCDTLAPSPCDHCGDNTKDTLRCSFKDNKNICQDCFQALPTAKREDIGEQEWVCVNPCNKKVKFFCKTCHLGTCKECAGGIHEGHDVVCVMKLAEEIRRDLTEQHELVTRKADEISQQRVEFFNCVAEKNTAFEEARRKLVKNVNGIKKIIEDTLEKEVDDVNGHTDKKIQKLEEEIKILRAKRAIKIKQLASEALDDISRTDELRRDTDTQLLEDEESRNSWIPKVEGTLKDDSEACESAKKEITNFLDSTLENLVLHGGPFRSLVKSSLLSQSQDRVVEGCKEIVNNLPKLLEKEPQNFIESNRSSELMLTFSTAIFLIFVIGEMITLQHNIGLDSDSLRNRWFTVCGVLVPCIYKCLFHCLQDCPLLDSLALEFCLPFRKAFMLLIKLGYFTLCSEIIVTTSQMILNLCHFFQMEKILENTVQLMSLLHSVFFIAFIRQSKTFRQSWSAAMFTVLHFIDIVPAKLVLVYVSVAICYRFIIKYYEDNSIL